MNSLSSGERKGNSPNLDDLVVSRPMSLRGCKTWLGKGSSAFRELQTVTLAEGLWNEPPQRVKAL